jgi:flagellar hook-associated protein 2
MRGETEGFFDTKERFMSVSNLGSSPPSSAGASASASAPSNLATNQGPVSFTGLASGLNYNAIISGLTNATAQQEVPLKAKITNLTSRDTEISTISGLLQTLQSSLSALSNSTTFNAFDATSSNTAIVNAQQTAGAVVTPGIYSVTNATVGSATQVTSSGGAGHIMNDTIAGTPSTNLPLVDSYAQVTPTNGSSTLGKITVNGVSVTYDVTTQSLNTILANIQSQVRAATGDASFTASYDAASDTVTLSSTNKPITFGATNDSGNLAQVLKLDVAQITNTATTGTMTSAYGIGGINQYENFTSSNGQGNPVNAGYITPVTAGTFTINGVTINITPSSEAPSDVIKAINASSAGVVANFDSETGKITLANKTAGAMSIVLGSSNDTSNFLTASGLVAGGGLTPTTTIGTQAKLVYNDPGGTSHTVYSNGNHVANGIPGLSVDINSSTSGTPVTLNVAQSPMTAEAAINTFVTAYNNVVNEINIATAAPIVSQKVSTHGFSASAVGGGVLYGNNQIAGIKNELVSLVSSLQSSGSQSYNSLANIGLKLDTTFNVLTASGTGNSGSLGSSALIGMHTYQGTDGRFTALDTTTFAAAFSADPNAVTNLFTGASNFVNEIGTYLTQVTGTATHVATGIAGTLPPTSTIGAILTQNQNIIDETNAQIAQIEAQVTAQANLLTTEFNASDQQLQVLQRDQTYLNQLSGATASASTSPSH